MLIIWLFVVLVVIGLAFVNWGDLLRRSFGNNPNRAVVKMRVGNEYFPYKAKLSQRVRNKVTNSVDSLYEFKMSGKSLLVVVPESAPVEYERGRRVIVNDNGRFVAGYGQRVDFTADQIEAIWKADIVTKAVQGIKGKASLPMWVLVAGGAVLLLAVGYWFMTRDKGGEALPSPTPNPFEGAPSKYVLDIGVDSRWLMLRIG